MRILQIVESLHQGATENWLVRACEAAATLEPHWRWTFYCIHSESGRLEEQARGFGAKLVYSPCPVGNKRLFFSSMRSFLQTHPHDILHCHHDLMSAVYLWAALGVPFRKRIVHIHNAQQDLPTPIRWKSRLLVEPMRQTCLRLADHVVAISQHTLAKFLKNAPPREGRDSILPCGTDTRPFAEEPDPVTFRRTLGFATSAKIVLFVGRMIPLKNPLFVVEMLEILAQRDPTVVCCFIGTGPLVSEVEHLAVKKSLLDRVRLLGWRDDVGKVMQVSNLFVFPSREEIKEGLGLVVVEAQSAGLPMLLSLAATEEAVVIPELWNVLPLATGPDRWASVAAEILSRPCPDRHSCLQKVEASPLSFTSSVSRLRALYQ